MLSHLGVASIYMAAALPCIHCKLLLLRAIRIFSVEIQAYLVRSDCLNESNFGCIMT